MTRGTALTALSAVVLALAACSPPSSNNEAAASDAAKAKTAADLGGLDKLVEAAKKEGQLNVIALPPDWANYGEIIKAFGDKYDITVNSDQPDVASQDEINAATQLAGTDRAPDVFDLGPSVALANTDMFAPYQVETWAEMPSNLRDPDGGVV